MQGLGAAIMNPATLGIITATFPPRQRGMAIGIWAGVSAMALAIGPLLGGLITDHIDWSWIFFVNVPVGVLGIIVARWAIDESRDTSHEQRLDLPGLATSAVGLFALTYALIEANTYGWTSPRILAIFAVAAIALTAFVLLELRQRVPMLDLTLFRDPTFTGANLTMLLVSLAMFGIFFFNSLFLQNVLGYSATQTGAVFLPMTVLIIVVAPWAGRYSDKVGSRWLVGAGMTLVSLSLVLFAQLDAGSTFWNILPGLLAGGLGMALVMTPTTAAAMGAVDVDKAGVGSAVLNCSRQVGGSLGIAVMGAIVASQVDPTTPLPLRAEQFVDGYHLALYVASVSRCAALRWQSSPSASTSTTSRSRRRLCDGHPVRGWRPQTAGPRSSMRRSRSSRPARTAARRRPRSPAPRASRSRSSIATSARSASSFSPAWTRCGGDCAKRSRRR